MSLDSNYTLCKFINKKLVHIRNLLFEGYLFNYLFTKLRYITCKL